MNVFLESRKRPPNIGHAKTSNFPVLHCDLITSSSNVLVDSLESLRTCLDAISKFDVLGVDLEGMVQMAPGVEEEAASGNRKCALLSVGAKDCPVYVIDVHILGDVVWDTPAASGEVTLRSIFASESVVKLLWDCRFDNYTLVVGHGVRLTHVIDLQVLAAKQLSDRAGLPGLHRSTLNALWPGNTVADDFEAASEAGSKIWCPRLGGACSLPRLQISFADSVRSLFLPSVVPCCAYRKAVNISRASVAARAARVLWPRCAHPALSVEGAGAVQHG